MGYGSEWQKGCKREYRKRKIIWHLKISNNFNASFIMRNLGFDFWAKISRHWAISNAFLKCWRHKGNFLQVWKHTWEHQSGKCTCLWRIATKNWSTRCCLWQTHCEHISFDLLCSECWDKAGLNVFGCIQLSRDEEVQ